MGAAVAYVFGLGWGPLTKRIIKHVKPWDMIEAAGISPSEGVYLLAGHNPG